MTRIDTLIPYKAPNWKPAAKLGTLDTNATPHAISAKLGRFLAKNISEHTREQVAETLAETIAAQPVEPYDPEPDSLKAWIAKDMTNPLIFKAENGTIIYAADKMPARKKGHSRWHWSRRHIGEQEQVDAIGFRIETALGAYELLGNDPENIRKVITETKYALNPFERAAFNSLAVYRWEGEIRREANRRFSEAHSAGVFMDKKHCDDKHKAAADASRFHMFRHVEIDDDIDLDIFSQLDREFSLRWDSGELPRISMGNAFRFRKTGRHSSKTRKTIGVYSPTLHAIAVDPRAPRSLLHEFAHAYDYEHGQLSCSTEFAPIINEYRNRLDTTGMGEAETRYALTPTEIFARCWEIHALNNDKAGSFISPGENYGRDPLYKPLMDMKDDIETYFATIGE